MRKLIVISVFIVLAGCSREWNGKVRYVVTGANSPVDVAYSTDSGGVEVPAAILPWDSGDVRADATDEDDFDACAEVTNKSGVDSQFEIVVYIDGKEKRRKNGLVKNGDRMLACYTVVVK